MTGAVPQEYSRTQKSLHWAIAALVLAQYLAFDGIARAFGAGMREGGFEYSGVVVGHIVAGVLILGLTLWRLALRLTRGVPPAPAAEPGLARVAAGAAHWGFYGLLIAMAASGAVAWFGHVGPAAAAHMLGKTLLLALIGLHVAAVLAHQLWWRTGLIGRMT
ncbi:cytochrome b/b6 domain-containing protein [Amaricoccus sp.]|uniref:cytochrome b n=1 Tax=Amaricoccus sp. TaxID=1872485 RepID=UPI001B715CBA|nr:cytochrome b/b6 domain-containing protein [Amaricoccus sp.]MBP7002780.1 cytochrome b/b6 domain-containing protein [Amaricoccus sp.]